MFNLSLLFVTPQLFSVAVAGSCSGVEDQANLLGLQATRGMSQNIKHKALSITRIYSNHDKDTVCFVSESL